jgi:hypothetical protein
MTKMQNIQEAEQRGRRRGRWGPSLIVAILVALASMVLVAPASAAPTVVSESASQITASDATLEATIATQPAEDVITQFQLATSPEGLSPEFQCPHEWVNSSLCIKLHGETPFPVRDVEPPGGTVSVSLAGKVTLSPSTTYYYRILAAKTMFGTDFFVVEPPVVYGAIQSFTTPAPSPPTVTRVEPNRGSPSGATTVTITGTELTGATAVKFGSTNAAGFKVNSDKSITAVSPAGTGTVDVTVETPSGTSPTSEADRFTYGATVTHVEPNHGSLSGGTTVTLTGTGFTGATAVKFGSTNATSFTVNSDTSITAVSPAGTGTVDVTVTTPSGTSPTSEADRFTYGTFVTSVEPAKGPAAGGTSVTIIGTGFTGATAVKFGSTNATSFTVNSDTSITAVSPTGTGTVDVTVASPSGTSPTSEADHFRYGPTVTSVEPAVGPAAGGTSVTITGTGFTGAVAAKFGSNFASIRVNSDTSITATSPAGTGTVDVTVETPGGISPTSEADRFTYGPTVTKVEPTIGPAAGGTSVTITGTGFTGATAVKFGSNNATSFTVNSATSITVVSPAGAGAVDVTVTTPAGASPTSAADQFTYGPTVTKVEPNHGSPGGGTTVTITGTGFTGTTAVMFGSTGATSFTVNSATSITAVSPKIKRGGTVDVTVTTPAGTSPTSAADQFTYSKK